MEAMASRFAMALALLAAAAGLGVAQVDCDIDQVTLRRPEIATNVTSSCPDFDGYLTLEMSSHWQDVDVSLDGPTTLNSLRIDTYSNLSVSVESSTLRNIREGFHITNRGNIVRYLTIVSANVSFPQCQALDRIFILVGTEQLATYDFGSAVTNYTTVEAIGGATFGENFSIGSVDQVMTVDECMFEALKLGRGVSYIKELRLRSNEGLSTVSLPYTEVDSFIVYGNPNLRAIDIGATTLSRIHVNASASLRLTNATDLGTTCSFSEGEGLQCEGSIADTSVRGLVSFEAPKLRGIDGDGVTFFHLDGNWFDFLEFPSLAKVSTGLGFTDNNLLETLSLPRLEEIGNLVVANNTALRNITANLATRAGNITMTGGFSNVEFFSLTEVTGSFRVSGDDGMDCSWFDEKLKPVVRGSYSCVGNHTKPAGGWNPSTPTEVADLPDEADEGDEEAGSGSGRGGGGLSTGAKAGIGVGVTVLVIVVVLGTWGIYFRGKKKSPKAAAGTSGTVEKPELDGNPMQQPAQVSDNKTEQRHGVTAVPLQSELHADDKARFEMASPSHGRTEGNVSELEGWNYGADGRAELPAQKMTHISEAP